MISKVATIGIKAAIPLSSAVTTKLGMPDLAGVPRTPNYNIDLTKDVIVLWVPGTSNHAIPDTFSSLVNQQFSSVSIHLVDYMASWSFSKSLPNGEYNLTAVLDYLSKHLRKGQRLMLAGESQGAWVISDVLSDSKYKSLVDKVVLLGHPGVSERHFTNDSKVLEINHPQDVTTIPVNVDKKELAEHVERIVHCDVTALPYILKVGLLHPNMLVSLGIMGLSKVPIVGDSLPKLHDYNKDMLLAVLWLAS